MKKKTHLLFTIFSCLLQPWKMLLIVNLTVLQIYAQTFPGGFSQVKVAGLNYPTGMTFAPDGRIFITEKGGKVRIFKNGTLLSTPFLQVTVEQTNERGLQSVILDPDFNTNHYVYIYYTVGTGTVHNRLSRFTANGDVALAGSELALLDFEPVVNSIHNGGGMAFGPDGKLYLAIGDDHVPSNAQDLNNHKGKLLRINKDGSTPSDNPFSGSAAARRIWAYGFRNPYTIAIQPGTGKLFINDVGEASWEEINDATASGKNFGWPFAEGNSSNSAYSNPVYTYAHGTSGNNVGCAITGGTFFNPSSTNYPAQYTGKYFFIDYCGSWLNYIDISGSAVKTTFATSMPASRVIVDVGKDGNLYYFSLNTSSLYKIIYTSNNAPVITNQPLGLTVSEGQSATFSVSASGATPLSYQWKKNGININGATSASYTILSVQMADSGQYTVVVSNAYGNVTSNAATLKVTPYNAPPVAIISSPTNGSPYRAGDIINFSGTGTDQEEGILPASAFTWTVEFHHGQHIHPGPLIPQGTISGSITIPVTGEVSTNVYFRFILTVKDSKGLTNSKYVDIFPRTSTITLLSEPTGLQVTFDGQPHATPFSTSAVVGMKIPIGVISPQSMNNVSYLFDHWQHGGNATQEITITDSNTSYTAVFKINPNPSCSATGSILREYWSNIYGYSISSIPVNNPPTGTSQLSIFEGPTGAGNNYGSRIRGYVCPPLTGNYIFWIASDNNSELWLSTNDNPANKVKIASVTGWTQSREWTKYATQKSAPVSLVAGQKYYIEALHKEVDMGDNIAVGWQLPDGSLERPIPGSRLSPFITGGTTSCIATITPSGSATFCSGGSVVLNANTGSGYLYQWKKNGTAIAGATATSYTATTSGDYQIKITQGSCIAWSAPKKVTVNTSLTAKITAGGPSTFCTGGSVKLYANTCSGYTYQWKRNGADIPGATAPTYTATLSGDYQIKIVQGSAIAWSALTTVTVTSCKEQDALSNPEQTDSLIAEIPEISTSTEPLLVKVYPNPTNGQFVLEIISMADLENEKLIVEVIDALGQLVYLSEPTVVNGNIKKAIELDKELPTGIYFLKIRIGDKEESTRVMLAK